MPASKIASPRNAAARKNGQPVVRAKKVVGKRAPREYTAAELWNEEDARFFQPYFDRLAGKKA